MKGTNKFRVYNYSNRVVLMLACADVWANSTLVTAEKGEDSEYCVPVFIYSTTCETGGWSFGFLVVLMLACADVWEK